MATSLIERIRNGDKLNPLVAAPLALASPIIQFGMRRRLGKPAERMTAYVISFGNLTAGGTGKTPAVIERAQREVAEGYRVGILTRGYHAPAGHAPAISAELEVDQYYAVLGDEAALLLQKVPQVIVFKDANRNAAARRAIDDYGCNVLILDDGYQFTALDRDENILLIDAVNSFGNGKTIPRGILREPLSRVSRATEIWLSRCDQARDDANVVARLRKFAPHAPIRLTKHAPISLRRLVDGAILPLSDLRDREVAAACGIGHPEAFFATLEGLGARLTHRHAFPNHEPIELAALPNHAMVVITEKDAVRITNPPENLHALEVALQTYSPSM